MRRTRAVLFWALVPAAFGCDKQASLCHERMTSAQAIVSNVDGKSPESVKQSLAAVEEAYATCERAKLGAEREQLLKAKNELTAQRDLLEARARRKKQVAPTPEELTKLAKSGDPSCPRGQAYKPAAIKSEIRCTGPQIVEMTSEALKDYYGDRHFTIKTQESPAEVRAELGAELYVFAFDKLSDPAPRCVTVNVAPRVSWQEITSRLTGVAPEKLKLDTPVKTSRGELALRVEHPEDSPKIRLGQCGT